MMNLDQSQKKILNWMTVAFIIVLTLVFTMASFSRFNNHPDEFVHEYAAAYYKTNYLPPEVCSTEILESYSSYGYSRLDKNDVSYFFIGRFMQLVDFVPAPDYLKARYFNVLLLVVIMLLSMRHINARILALPFLITPQVWYLFSYVNSEAFALFIAYLMAYQLFVPDSILQQLIKRKKLHLLHLLLMAGLFSMPLLFKQTMYFYIGYLVGAFCLMLFFRFRDLKAFNIKNIIILLLLSITLFAGLRITHEAVNNFDLKDRMQLCHYYTAKHQYREDIPLDQSHPQMYWKEKSVDVSYMFTKNWHKKVAQSAFGDYGYLQYFDSPTFYTVMLTLFCLLLLLVFFRSLWRGNNEQRLLMLGAMFILGVNITAAFWLSYVYDFQPQGRYMIFFVSILGLLLVQCRQILVNKWILSICFIMWLMSVYSFVFIGLMQVQRWAAYT